MASRGRARTDRGKRAKRMQQVNVTSLRGDREIPASRSVTIRVPLALNRRRGRKLVVTPNGAPAWSPPKPYDNTLVKALARAHRWNRMIESGEYTSLTDLAHAERICQSYVARMLRLTLLAPDITQAILDGRAPRSFQLDHLLRPFPREWEKQGQEFQAAV